MKTILVISGAIIGISMLGGLLLAIYSSLKDKDDEMGHLIAAFIIGIILFSLFGWA